jgi:tRNA (cytidine/uridine-2'-O-)-methyltransferase
VKRAGLDYWFRVHPCLWPDWKSLEVRLPELGEPFFFSAEGERTLWEVDYPESTVLIFGSETRGLPSEVRRRYNDRLLRLPQVPSGVRSLNLSTAAGIAMYEVLRQHPDKHKRESKPCPG